MECSKCEEELTKQESKRTYKFIETYSGGLSNTLNELSLCASCLSKILDFMEGEDN